MSKVYLDDSILIDISNAIRAKTGRSGLITPANMATEISNLPSLQSNENEEEVNDD